MITTPIAPSIETCNVVGSPVSAMPFESYVETMIDWAHLRLSRVVCVANVHMLTEARSDDHLASVLRDADLVTPDGMPLVWMLKALRNRSQDRAAGMDLMLATCRRAEQERIPVFFIGSERTILDRMRNRLQREFPSLIIGGLEPLPFGNLPLPIEQEKPVLEKIRQSRSGIVFVSLGCPKQEKWMDSHRNSVSAVMVGIGGVFPIYAGILSHAPQWAQDAGLEWFYRLIQEPKRLWKRYASTIPPFIYWALKQLITGKVSGKRGQALRSRSTSIATLGAVNSEVD